MSEHRMSDTVSEATQGCKYLSFHAITDEDLAEAIRIEIGQGSWRYQTTEKAMRTVRWAQSEGGECPGCGWIFATPATPDPEGAQK